MAASNQGTQICLASRKGFLWGGTWAGDLEQEPVLPGGSWGGPGQGWRWVG